MTLYDQVSEAEAAIAKVLAELEKNVGRAVLNVSLDSNARESISGVYYSRRVAIELAPAVGEGWR